MLLAGRPPTHLLACNTHAPALPLPQAYVVLLADGTAVFAFRGTAQMLPDWATNFDMARRSLEGDARGDRDRGDVHQGGCTGGGGGGGGCSVVCACAGGGDFAR
jgi:hypothetical protein